MPFVEVINKLGSKDKLNNLKIIVTDDRQIKSQNWTQGIKKSIKV